MFRLSMIGVSNRSALDDISVSRNSNNKSRNRKISNKSSSKKKLAPSAAFHLEAIEDTFGPPGDKQGDTAQQSYFVNIND
mmetsp:Transcript_38435/g.58519  ORF Transcript_38435/g.58519 Transcript_38435/m.58519 type:complete len:80 (-) Transcript_38435:446-685(-)